jgi:hypothetical protein
MNKSNSKNTIAVILALVVLLFGFIALNIYVQSNMEYGINPEKLSPTITSSNGINPQ